MNEDEKLYDNSEMSELDSNRGVQKVQTVQEVNQISPISSDTSLDLGNTRQQSTGVRTTSTSQTPTQTHTYESYEKENEAKNQAELEVAAGVSHVLDDKETEDYVSTKELYTKTLGVTEYDELRAKLHLRDDESFTDYYNRTGYIPEGFEMQAKLLLAEEKRKKLYAEVEAGNMSEEDFLYEAYGKDLLKQEGIDFSSPLYWYQRYKSGEYDDPRDNSTFMLDLIENARTLFQQEKWYEEATTQDILEMASKVTGEVLDAKTVSELFPEFFEQASEYYDSAESIVKYYRAGLLQGFNPTIDADGDGKIDYYYATDGKLYHVNETGKGANTMRAVYNDDGSLNRIVASDTYFGEIMGGLFGGIARFFTDIVDLGALLVGAVVDVFDGGEFGDTVAEYSAAMGQFWNSIPIPGSKDYVVDSGWTTSDGKANWANYGRQLSNLVGYIVPTVVLAIATGGASAGAQAGGAAAKTAATAGAKAATKGAARSITKAAVKSAKSSLTKRTFGQTIKAVGKKTLQGAVALTKYQYGFGATGWAARIGSATTVAIKDTLTATAALKINQEYLGLSDRDIVVNSLGLGAIDFLSGVILRSVGDESALSALSKGATKLFSKKSAVFNNDTVKSFFTKIATNSLTKTGDKVIYGLTNGVMDSMDNLLTSVAQTSLMQSGQLFSSQGFISVLNNPQFVMNIVYQSFQTAKESNQISTTKIMEATFDSLKMDTTLRTYFNLKIQEAEAKNDIDTARSLRAVLAEYDKDIIKYMSTENAEYATEIKRLREKEGDNTKKAQDTKQSQESTTQKTTEDSKTTSTKDTSTDTDTKKKIVTRADKLDSLESEGIPTYTKAEAILLSIANLLETKLKVDSNSPLYETIRADLENNVNSFLVFKNENIFRQANADNVAYNTMARNFFTTKWANLWYGKDARNLQMTVMKSIYDFYYNKDVERFTSDYIEYDPIKQLNADLEEQGKIYDKLLNMLAPNTEEGDKILDMITSETLLGKFQVIKNKDGTPKVNKKGNPIYTIEDKNLSEGKIAGLKAFLETLNEREANDLNNFLLISVKQTGGAVDGSEEMNNARNYLKITHKFWEELMGEDSPIVSIGEDMYVFKPMGLGKTMQELQNIGLFLRSITSLKLALSGKQDTAQIKTALQSVLTSTGILTKSSEVDTVIEDNLDIIPSFINTLLDSKTFNLRDTTAILNNIQQLVVEYNRTRDVKDQVRLPVGTDGTGYSNSLKLIDFLKDWNDVQEVLRPRRTSDSVTEADLKVLNKFAKTYATMDTSGQYNYNEIVTLAEEAGFLSSGQLKALRNIRNFLREKVDTSLESVRIQKREPQQLPNTDVSIDDVKTYLADRFSFNNYQVTRKVPGSSDSGQRVFIKDLGTEKDFNEYLSSLNINPDDDTDINTHINSYVNSVLKTLGEHVTIEKYPLDDLIREALDRDTTPEKRAEAQLEIKKRIESKFDNSDILNSELKNIKKIVNLQEPLGNHTNMVVVDLNLLSSATGAKVKQILDTDPTKSEALARANNMEDVVNILFSSNEAKQEFIRGINQIERLQEQYGADSYLELPLESQTLRDIITTLGYHPRVITELTNGDLSIPGIYFNNDNEGIRIADKTVANKVISDLEYAIDKGKTESLRNTITFRDPINTINDLTGLITLVNEDAKLHPTSIILNSISSDADFNLSTEEAYNIILTSIKQGKNAGALFKYLLTSTEGVTAKGTIDNQLDKVVKTYRIINAFADLYDGKNKNTYGVQELSALNASKLQKTYAKNKVQPFLFTPATYDSSKVLVSLNPAVSKDEFLNIVLNKFKGKTGIRALSQVIPIETSSTLRNNVTRNEPTNISSAYTTLSWLENKLHTEMDVYAFTDSYKDSDLDINNVDITTKAYNDALNYLQNKSKTEVMNDTNLGNLENNVFLKMQKNAYIASTVIRDSFIEKLSNLVDTSKVDIEVIAEMLGNVNHRRDLSRAIRKSLEDLKSSLTLKSGFIEVTDEFAQSVLDNIRYTDIKIPGDQAEVRNTYGSVTGSQLSTTNPEIDMPDLNLDSMKEILKLIPLEYSVLTKKNYFTSETKLLAMIKSASHTEDGSLCLSTKDLYLLDDADFDALRKVLNISKKDKHIVNTMQKALKNSTYYTSKHNKRILPEKLENTDIMQPSKSSTSGDIFEGKLDTTSIDNEIKRLIHNAQLSHNNEQYVKISTILDSKYQQSYEMRNLANLLNINVLPYVDHQGSLQLQNLKIEENLYYFYHNLMDFSDTLIRDYGLKKDTAINLAFNYYMYSTGMQTQAAHPEFIFVDKKTGNVIDIAMSGSKSDRDSGMIARLYNNYFEPNEDGNGIKFKESFKHMLVSGQEIEVNPKDLIAVRLNTNIISTTFKKGNFDVSIYDIGNNESKFINMFIDKIHTIEKANSLVSDDPNYRKELANLVNKYFYEQEYTTSVGKNREIINQSKGLFFKDSSTTLTRDLEQLNVLSDSLTESEITLRNELDISSARNEYNTRERDINDMAHYGVSHSILNNTDGLFDYISASNRKIKTSMFTDSERQELERLNAEIDSKQNELNQIRDDITELHSKVEGPNPEVSKGTEEYSYNADLMNSYVEKRDDAIVILNYLRNKRDKLYDNLRSRLNTYSDIIELYKDNRFQEAISTLEQEYANSSKETVVKNILKEYIRQDKSVESTILKVIDYDIDSMRNRNFETLVSIGNKQIPITQILKKPFVMLDAEAVYNNTETHVYEVSLLYYDGKNFHKAVKYFPYTDKDGIPITDINILRNKFPNFFTDYYDKYKGTKTSIKNLINNKNSGNFDKILEEANSKNAIIIGFNSKNFDIPNLTRQGILSEDIHSNLLANHIDVFDLAKSPINNLNMYGGRATLAAIAEQLGIKDNNILNAHLSSADTDLTLDVLKELIKRNSTHYSSKLVDDISDLYKTLMGKNTLDDADYKFIKEAFEDVKLSKEEYTNTKDLEDLKQFSNNVLHDDTYYSKVANVLRLVNEKDIINRTNVLIKALNKVVSKSTKASYIKFADEFSSPKMKNNLLDAVAFLLDDIKPSEASDTSSLGQQYDKVFTRISNILTNGDNREDNIINELIDAKDIYTKLGIDTSSEKYKEWKKDNGYRAHTLVDRAIRYAYGDSVSKSYQEDTVRNSIASSFKNVYSFVDSISFLSDRERDLIKNMTANMFDYKGEYKDLSNEVHLDLFSNQDKDSMDWFLTDPLLTSRQVGIYKKATSTTNKITLLREEGGKRVKTYPKNMTVYLTEQSYRDLFGYGKEVVIDPNNTGYVGVIRYPADKLDSIHYLKLEIMEDSNLETVVTPDTMLLLNGDLDGDNIKIIRPDDAQNIYGKDLYDAGKYFVYSLLDDITEATITNPNRNRNRDIEKSREYFKVIEDNELADQIARDIKSLYEGVATYDILKNNFMNKYSGKYSKELLNDIYVKPVTDLSELTSNNDIVYVSYLANPIVLQLQENIQGKRANLFANASKRDIVAFNDTQSGMFQKGLLFVDYSQFEDIELVDNAIRLSGTTRELLNEIPTDKLKDMLNNSNNESLKNIASQYSDILDGTGDNSDKIELILKLEQMKMLKSQNYKDKVFKAVKTLKSNSENSPFVTAFNSFIKGNTEHEFFNTIDKIVQIKKSLQGNRFTFGTNKEFIQILQELIPEYSEAFSQDTDSIYNPGKVVPMLHIFGDTINSPEDTIQWVGWEKDGKQYGANNLHHISAANTKRQSEDTLKSLRHYKKLDKMSERDVRALGIPYNKAGTYYYVATNNNIVTYIRTFNIDTAKVDIEGNANTKSTPTKTITNLNGLDSTLRKVIEDNNLCGIIKVKREFNKQEKISNRYEKGSYTLIDSNGNVTENIDDAIGFISNDRINVLENSLTTDMSAKPVALEESAYGNNMLGTGGIGITYGVFVDTSKGKPELRVDNSKYLKVKREIESLQDYDRYSVDATDLYEHLATAYIVDNLPSKELEGKSKQEFYMKKITSNNARSFIYEHLPKFQNATGKAGKILSLDMYNTIYGISQSGVDTTNLKSTTSSNKGVTKASLYYTPEEELRGPNAKLYNINHNPNMTTAEFINATRNEGDTVLTSETIKKAEQLGFLLNRQIDDSYDPYTTTNNNNPKTGQNLGQHTYRPAVNSIFDEGDSFDPDYENYYSRYKYKSRGKDIGTVGGFKQAPIREISKTLQGGIDYITGKRIANIFNSLLNTRGTYKDRDSILQALNPNVSLYQSMHMNELFFDANANIKLRQRKVDITPEGYREVTIPQARQEIYNQRSSPYYWAGIRESSENSITDTVMNTKETPNLRTSEDLTIEDLGDTTVSKALDTLATPSEVEAKYLDASQKYLNDIANSALEDTALPKHYDDNSNTTEFVSGDLVGTKVFEESRFGLNQGLKIRDEMDLIQDRNLRQVAVDEQNTRRTFINKLNNITNMAKANNCADELNLYAYVIALNARINSDAKDYTFTVEEARAELKHLGIDDSNKFIKDFTEKHSKLANAFNELIYSLNEVTSKYSKETNEPTDNIFMLLSPNVRNNQKSKRMKVDSIKEIFAKGDPQVISMSQDNSNKNFIPYSSYRVFDSLNETISAVSKRAAIVENAKRLKTNGVIDSVKVQSVLEEAFKDKEVTDKILNPTFTNKAKTQESLRALEAITGRLQDKFSNDEEFIDALDSLLDRAFPGNNQSRRDNDINAGAIYLELLKVISNKTSKYKLSLDDALELANKTTGVDSGEADNVIYLYKQMQAIYTQLAYINKDISTEIYNRLNNYAKENNLVLVDKYGRMFDKDFVYSMNETSLEHLPKAMELELSKMSYQYEGFITLQALAGNAFLMDADLANTFAKRVFVKQPLSKFQRALQKTSNWCVKMLMSSPFKLIDRLIKFTLFDFSTLGSANHKTLFKEGEAQKDLRAFFSSRGNNMSKNMQEFIDTQGISFDGMDFDGLITGDSDSSSGGIFKTYTNAVGDIFTFQTLSQRYAYWLATKEAIEKGDYSVVGSAYYLADQMKNSGMTPGQQASFAMAQLVGGPNDFPAIAKTFNKYGFVFTTFPLAATRWGIGQLRSASAALHDLFTEGSRKPALKWLARNSSGILATFMLEQFIVYTIAEMYGVDEDDEDREEWSKLGALPNVTQTLIQGQPIMDTFTSLNPYREVVNMFIDTTNTEEEEEESINGLTRFIRKNIISHVNPIAKGVGEVIVQKDLIDDQVIDTKEKYTALENVFRKASAYFLGASGANAFVKTFSNNSYEDIPSTFTNALTNAVKAELGNTKATKENRKNYYKALSILNEYIYGDEDQETQYSNSSSFNYSNYSVVKSKIYSLINQEAPLTQIYSEIENLINSGYTLTEIRAAFKNCSISGKLDRIENMSDLIDSISEAELQNIKTALAYENYVLPWLDEGVSYLTKEINQSRNSSYYNNFYVPNYYMPNNYIQYYQQPDYSIPTSYDNYYKQNTDVYNVYSDFLKNQRYQKQQLEYANQRAQWRNS